MSKTNKLTTLLLTANIVALPIAMAWADPIDPEIGEPVLLPYQATVLDDQGDPVDGNHTVEVRVFSDETSDADELYAETFAGHVIEDGTLTLVVGAGEAQDDMELGAEVLWRNPGAVMEVVIDGEALGSRHQLGAVPRALHARRVPASGIRFGDSYGVVPAEALEPHVEVVEGVYKQGDSVLGLPEGPGWTCEHTVTPASPGAQRDRLHAQDLWVGHIGEGSVSPAPNLTVTFGGPGAGGGVGAPGIMGKEVFFKHAWSTCDASWGAGCQWVVEPAAAELRVHVASVCTRF